jgi:hypothetical protein
VVEEAAGRGLERLRRRGLLLDVERARGLAVGEHADDEGELGAAVLGDQVLALAADMRDQLLEMRLGLDQSPQRLELRAHEAAQPLARGQSRLLGDLAEAAVQPG